MRRGLREHPDWISWEDPPDGEIDNDISQRGGEAADIGERLPTQLEVVRQVMLLASQYGSWMTLESFRLRLRKIAA